MPGLGISVDSASEHSSRPKSFLSVPWSLHPTPNFHPIGSLQPLKPSVGHGSHGPAKVKDCPAAPGYSLGSEKVPTLAASVRTCFSCWIRSGENYSQLHAIGSSFIKPLPPPAPSSSFFLLSLLLLPSCSISSSICMFSWVNQTLAPAAHRVSDRSLKQHYWSLWKP